MFETPPFDTATLVYALYCDGGSWSGNALKPVSAKPNASAAAQTIYYRGRPLLDGLYDHLLAQGLAAASVLLFAGCSAGGGCIRLLDQQRLHELARPAAGAIRLFARPVAGALACAAAAAG